MPTEVLVIGAGGFGREALDVIEASNAVPSAERIEVIGVADDAPRAEDVERLRTRGYQWIGGIAEAMDSTPPGDFVLGIGNPSVRRTLSDAMTSRGWRPLTIIHPAATVSPTAHLGPGAVVCGGVQLSTNTRLGLSVHLNPNSTIGHDAVLGDYVSINPAAVISGSVSIADDTLIGAGAVILQNLAIGRGATVGANACVTRDVAPCTVVVGTPARPIHRPSIRDVRTVHST